MDSLPSNSKSHSLFQVYLRLRPPQTGATAADRFLDVEPPATDAASTAPTHIRLNPPNDRRRAIEKFCFTQVFEEDASQLDVFHCTNVVPLVEGVLAPHGGEGTDALLATLGVTGSGKSHTILGSRSQRGLTQLTLDVLFRSIGHNIADCATSSSLEASINASDASEATIYTASTFLDSVYADASGPSHYSSRAPTPMIVRPPSPYCLSDAPPSPEQQYENKDDLPECNGSLSGLPIPGMFPTSPSPSGRQTAGLRQASVRIVRREDYAVPTTSCALPVPVTPVKQTAVARCGLNMLPGPGNKAKAKPASSAKTPRTARRFMASTTASSKQQKHMDAKHFFSQGDYSSAGAPPPPTPRRLLNRPSAFPQQPDISGVNVNSDPGSQYTVLVSMYEVYNDRIFDLLTPPIKSAATKEYRRRPLLFKSTELSPDRKVVAGLRKIICSNLNQALLVLEAGLHERRVAGTGSNSVSSRSHGFVCIEVKKRSVQGRHKESALWTGNVLTIVDLAGSERARDAKTAGATLAEAGKINESLMYLGQCLQMQSDVGSSTKPNMVPFRQCKLTELLFSNSFPSASMQSSHFGQSVRRNPQKAVMIVTADPHGDFNATSQILRYSALAREITVPRIPSITQTILGSAPATSQHGPLGTSPPLSTISTASSGYHAGNHTVQHHRPFFPPGSTASSAPHNRTFSPISNASSEDRVTMEIAALEISRLSEEIDYLRASLEQESEKRHEAESHLLSMTDRMLEQEQEIREDCAIEFETRLAVEMARWKASLEVEKERGEEHWDRKVEVMERLQSTETDENQGSRGRCDHEDKENVLVENLEEENERLRREIAVLKRELTGRSPVKRKPLRERDDLPTASPGASTPASAGRAAVDRHAGAGSSAEKVLEKAGESLRRKMERLRMSDDDADTIMGRPSGRPSGASVKSTTSSGSPKKMRKLSPRKWDVALDDDDLF
ncbi:uncharacterized protein SPSK_06976 [Sporothrix schenckii 1099-18]|uniref:Kinesin motor domain-containing protein n=1 Tax=Sporothrix schenckii 1099-18 TaxID=1397361 RepID=A0A0F2MG05_SPOSC|nr:uncharacterized protein SPSK_06976 [Sporothrix schenckii 1099-18]KJR88633.1 hypothetical protein SPSK_06976 [Sporothrix schenckii 1099-18]